MPHSVNSEYLDVTDLWLVAHPHLSPMGQDVFIPDSLRSCLQCGAVHAVQVFAHLRFGGNAWQEMAELEFCPDAGRFYLRKTLLTAYQQALGLSPDVMPSLVEARLWHSSPKILNIEPTTRCNFSCWYCVGRHMKQEDIELENFGKMLSNFPDLEALALVGEGEPLLHKDFFKMANMARERNIRVLTISNGSAFSQSVVRQLCESEIAYVSISIDSHLPDVFAASRLEGNLEKVWQGIRRLRTYRDEHGYAYPKIGLKGTLFKETQDQIPAIVAAAKENGVEIFESFQPLNPKESYLSIYPKAALCEVDSIAEVGAAIARDSVFGREELLPFQDFCSVEQLPFFPKVFSRPEGRSCNETWLYALLSGDITPCCQIKSGFSGRWNIFDKQLTEILADRDYENLRFNLWNGIFPNYCQGCWKVR